MPSSSGYNKIWKMSVIRKMKFFFTSPEFVHVFDRGWSEKNSCSLTSSITRSLLLIANYVSRRNTRRRRLLPNWVLRYLGALGGKPDTFHLSYRETRIADNPASGCRRLSCDPAFAKLLLRLCAVVHDATKVLLSSMASLESVPSCGHCV